MKPHELIADPKRWCTHSWAKTKDGCHVLWNDPEAVSFCMAAAAIQCGYSCFDVERFCIMVFGEGSGFVNDNYGHAIAVEALRLCFKDAKPR